MNKKILLFGFVLLALVSAGKKEAPSEAAANLIPKPSFVEEKGGKPFVFTSSTTFNYATTDDKATDAELEKIGRLFSARVEPAFGFAIQKGTSDKKGLQLIIDGSVAEKEGYRLEVDNNKVIIRGSSLAGIFYGTQTLYQLLPPQSKSQSKVEGVRWTVPQIVIEDVPRFEWRGNMVDVARHFFTLEQLRTHIDRMAEYKFNKLHLHLSDDQGWRIEIKGLSELTSERIAYRPDRVGDWWSMDPPTPGEPRNYGGYYTQEEMSELVRYAADRYIEIIPEIDVPGHSLSLIVAYPELYCFEPEMKDVHIGNGRSWEFASLCMGNPRVMDVMKIIFSELAEIFPTEYLHMGGDECNKRNWHTCPKCQDKMKQLGLSDVDELQSYFVHEMDEYITGVLGRKMVGWDEILEGGLAPNAIVMSWRGMVGGKRAAEMGHEVIMTPNRHCYVDLYQGDQAIEPLAYSRCSLRDCYVWDPVPEGISEDLILGGQANLWSERITTQRHFEYMFYPRSWATSEVLWSAQDARDWEEFFPRIEYHMKRADYADINYGVSAYNAWIRPFVSEDDGFVYVDFFKDLDDVEIYYTLDNTVPDLYSTRYDGIPFTLEGTNCSKINVQTYRDGKPAGKLFRVLRKDIEDRAVSRYDHRDARGT